MKLLPWQVTTNKKNILFFRLSCDFKSTIYNRDKNAFYIHTTTHPKNNKMNEKKKKKLLDLRYVTQIINKNLFKMERKKNPIIALYCLSCGLVLDFNLLHIHWIYIYFYLKKREKNYILFFKSLPLLMWFLDDRWLFHLLLFPFEWM